jgi:HTH-type transcriptional regulator/antitoxin HipB
MNQLARTPKQIGAILRRQRGLAKLSQTELAERAGLRQELVSKIESGKPGTRIETICDLFAALELDLLVAPRSKSSAKDIEDIF